MAKFSKGQYVVLMAALNKAGEIYVPKADEAIAFASRQMVEAIKLRMEEAYAKGKKMGVLVAAEFIADALGLDNPKFDRSHFLAVVRGEKPVNSRPVSSSSFSSSSSKGMYRVHGR